MPVPSLRAASFNSNVGNTLGLTVPAGITNNDIMIAAICSGKNLGTGAGFDQSSTVNSELAETIPAPFGLPGFDTTDEWSFAGYAPFKPIPGFGPPGPVYGLAVPAPFDPTGNTVNVGTHPGSPTSVDVVLPTYTGADLYLICVTAVTGPAGGVPVISAPPGWTLVRADDNGAGDNSAIQAVYSKPTAGDFGATVTFSVTATDMADLTCDAIALSVEAAGGVDSSAGVNILGAGFTTSPVLTPTQPGCLIVQFAWANRSGGRNLSYYPLWQPTATNHMISVLEMTEGGPTPAYGWPTDRTGAVSVIALYPSDVPRSVLDVYVAPGRAAYAGNTYTFGLGTLGGFSLDSLLVGVLAVYKDATAGFANVNPSTGGAPTIATTAAGDLWTPDAPGELLVEIFGSISLFNERPSPTDGATDRGGLTVSDPAVFFAGLTLADRPAPAATTPSASVAHAGALSLVALGLAGAGPAGWTVGSVRSS